MPRSKTAGLAVLAALTSAVALAPASAQGAQATFSVAFEAQRTASWDHPKTLLGGNCKGQNYVQGRGAEDRRLTSRPGGRLVVEGNGKGMTSYQFGIEGPRRTIISGERPDAKGVITRERHWVTGTTGGWCGGGEPDPVKKGDCGTRLAPFTYYVTMSGGEIGVREALESRTNENFGFYDCSLITPEGVPADSFPSLDKKLPLKQLFNRKASTIVIKHSKAYGPTLSPLPGGQNRTTSANYEWKLTLKRIKNLRPRSENG